MCIEDVIVPGTIVLIVVLQNATLSAVKNPTLLLVAYYHYHYNYRSHYYCQTLIIGHPDS